MLTVWTEELSGDQVYRPLVPPKNRIPSVPLRSAKVKRNKGLLLIEICLCNSNYNFSFITFYQNYQCEKVH